MEECVPWTEDASQPGAPDVPEVPLRHDCTAQGAAELSLSSRVIEMQSVTH